MNICVYGGQYGSEGKGSLSEWLIKGARRLGKRMIAIGENSPNSGHTCSLGKTQNIPAASFFADTVILGPDSAVSIPVLLSDLRAIKHATGKAPRVYIHEHAAFVCPADREAELLSGVVDRISSTGSGSGMARAYRKNFLRLEDAVIQTRGIDILFGDEKFEVSVLTRFQYINLIRSVVADDCDCIFECSQGALLDVNWGIYPYVTSRSTAPRVAIERNGLHPIQWSYVGVYRTFPIRTGGPSGPTGGAEIAFSDLGVEPEIATVTKRTRRIFEFSREDFQLSVHLNRPAFVAFTHLDYLSLNPEDLAGFFKWHASVTEGEPLHYKVEGLFLSSRTGDFINHGAVEL